MCIRDRVAAGINVITGKDAPGYTGDDTFTPELASLFTRVFDNRLVSRRLGTTDDGTSVNFTNLEEGLTQNGTVADGQGITNGSLTSDISNTERVLYIVLAAEMDLPSSFTIASCIWEVGGTGRGAFFGISKQSGEYFLRLRGGLGTIGVNEPTTDLAIAQVAVSSLPQYFDGNTHTLVWEINRFKGIVRIFIDGQLVAEGSTTDGSGFSTYAGSASGGFGVGDGVPAGGSAVDGSTQFQSSVAFEGTIRSDLRMYKGGQVITADISQQTSKVTGLDDDDILTNTSIGFKANKRDLT